MTLRRADSNSGRVMAALPHAAVIDVTAADQSRVKAGCRIRGKHVKMPWQRAACSGLKRAIPLWVTCSRNPTCRSGPGLCAGTSACGRRALAGDGIIAVVTGRFATPIGLWPDDPGGKQHLLTWRRAV